MHLMIECTEKAKIEEMKFQIALHGGKVDESGDMASQGRRTDDGDLVFKAPKEYEHLSMEERKDLTKRMMAKFRTAFSQNKNMGAENG